MDKDGTHKLPNEDKWVAPTIGEEHNLSKIVVRCTEMLINCNLFGNSMTDSMMEDILFDNLIIKYGVNVGVPTTREATTKLGKVGSTYSSDYICYELRRDVLDEWVYLMNFLHKTPVNMNDTKSFTI